MASKVVLTLKSGKVIRKEVGELARLPWTSVNVKAFPAPLWVCYGEVKGRTVIVGLILSPVMNQEITARSLRELPMSRLQMLPALSLTQGRLRRSADAKGSESGSQPGSKGYTREHYEEVAAEYKRALKTSPNSPALAVYSRRGVSEATMHRWLNRCKELGLLDSAKSSKKGRKPRIRALSMTEWIREVAIS